jgi:hypothetical protein
MTKIAHFIGKCSMDNAEMPINRRLVGMLAAQETSLFIGG